MMRMRRRSVGRNHSFYHGWSVLQPTIKTPLLLEFTAAADATGPWSVFDPVPLESHISCTDLLDD